jgi:hypothetical protein
MMAGIRLATSKIGTAGQHGDLITRAKVPFNELCCKNFLHPHNRRLVINCKATTGADPLAIEKT